MVGYAGIRWAGTRSHSLGYEKEFYLVTHRDATEGSQAGDTRSH